MKDHRWEGWLALTLFLLVVQASKSQESGGVRFLAHFISPSGGAYVGGSWGWTDSVTGREYALLGNECGTSIVEITNSDALTERDFIPGVCSIWREIQTYSHYAYVVSEGGQGTQIIDLSPLPDSAHLVKHFTYTKADSNTSRSHTIHIKDGYMYLNGCANWPPGGIVIFSLADPINPAFQSVYKRNYIHDCFVRHDTIYGAAINGIGVDIIDVTNKLQPKYLYTISYPGAGTHNCATTEDGKFLLTTDEVNSTPKTIKIWDLRNPPMFPKVAEYQGDPTAIVHNVFVKGNTAYMSYYTAGLKVIDITDPTHPIEIGGYDTYPGSGGGFAGAWSAYPFFPSGRITIGDMESGLYVVDLNTAAPHAPLSFGAYSNYLTPSSVKLTWIDPKTTISGDTLTNFTLHIYRNSSLIAEVDSGIRMFVDSSVIRHQFYTYRIRTVVTGDSSSAAVASAYAGGAAQPSTPTNFQPLDGTDGVTLRWKNPSTQIDNTPLNDLAYIDIYRDGEFLKSFPQGIADTGQVRTYIDSIIGYHYYKIRARDNEVPNNVSTFTDSLFAYGGTNFSYSEDFEQGRGSILVKGGWDTTHSIAHSGAASITDSPAGNYPDGENIYFISPPVIIGSNVALRFYHIAIMALSDFGFVEISKDHNRTYSTLRAYTSLSYPQWQDGHADPGDWVGENFSLANFIGDTISIRFRFQSTSSGNADGWYLDDISIVSVTNVSEPPNREIPKTFALEQNYPNPFNPSTAIEYGLPVSSIVRLKVFNILGQEVVTLVHENQSAGVYKTVWDGRDHNNTPMGSGLYIYSLDAFGQDGTRFAQQRKMILLR